MIDQTQYLRQRIDDQYEWYSRESKKNKNWYVRLRVLSIIMSLSIPILAGSIDNQRDDHLIITVVSILGALVAFIEGLMGLRKYHELWTEYRITAEGLKFHRYLFEAGAAPYDTAGAFKLFVQNAEGIMSTERAKWIQIATQKTPLPQLPDPPALPQQPAATDNISPEASAAQQGGIVTEPEAADQDGKQEPTSIPEGSQATPGAENENEDEDEDKQP